MLVKVNSALVSAPENVDGSLESSDDITYYFAVTAVDEQGDESVRSAVISPGAAEIPPPPKTEVDTSSPGSDSTGVCFISTAAQDGAAGQLRVLLLFLLIHDKLDLPKKLKL